MKLREKLSANFALHSSLGRSLTLYLLFLLIAVLFFSLWTLNRSWQQVIYDAQNLAVNLSISQTRQAEDTFLQTEITLRMVKNAIPDGNPARINTAQLDPILAEMKSRLPQLHGLFVYDAQGKWIATSGLKIHTDINNADREYFHYHRNNPQGSIHIGHVIHSRNTGDLVIPVSLRLSDPAGGFSGIVLATVRVDYFHHFYSFFELGERDLLALILDDGTALYVRPFSESVVNRNISASPLFTTQLMQANRGKGTWRSALDGIPRIFGYARSEHYPIIVAAGFDRPALWKRWLNNSLPDVVLNGALFIIILVMSVMVLRQVRTNVKNQLELTDLKDELTLINQTLQAMALLDGLTGLANRRQFDLFLTQNLKRSAFTGKPVSLVMIDIDYFKHYNDTYGHVAGDRCLMQVGAVLKEISHRKTDLVARYGGEEFAIVLPDTERQDALNLAWRAVNAVYNAAIPHQSSALAEKRVTISAGCYAMQGCGKESDALQIKEGADAALYQAKRGGRNRAAIGDEAVSESH